MKTTGIARIIIAAVFAFITSLFLVAGAMATTENECISGGGKISSGSGCRFCVGGKYDLSEISDSGKNGAAQSGAAQKKDKRSGQSDDDTSSKTSTDNRI